VRFKTAFESCGKVCASRTAGMKRWYDPFVSHQDYRTNHRSVYIFYPNTVPSMVPPINVVSYHVATDKLPPLKMATSSGLF